MLDTKQLTDLITVDYKKLGEHGLRGDQLQGLDVHHQVEVARTQQVGRPHDRQVLGGHAGGGRKVGHIGQMANEIAKGAPVWWRQRDHQQPNVGHARVVIDILHSHGLDEGVVQRVRQQRVGQLTEV